MTGEREGLKLKSTVQRNPEQEFSTIDNEVVMLSVREAKYLALNDVASRIWEIIENPKKIEQIIEILMQEYEVSLEECTEDVILCLEDFSKRSLIKLN